MEPNQPNFDKFLLILPYGRDVRTLANLILEKENAGLIFLYHPPVNNNFAIRGVKDIHFLLEETYGRDYPMSAILRCWKVGGRLTEIASLVSTWYREDFQRPPPTSTATPATQQVPNVVPVAREVLNVIPAALQVSRAAPTGPTKYGARERAVSVTMAPGQNRKVELMKSALELLAMGENTMGISTDSPCDSEVDSAEAWLLIRQRGPDEGINAECGTGMVEEMKKAAIVSADILRRNAKHLPQYALIGSGFPANNDVDGRLYWNVNQPSSVYICGLQGSGKSHTLACLLENCLIQSPSLGKLKQPLSGVVLHYSQFASTTYFQPCEAAFLSIPSLGFRGQASRVSVTVYCSPSNYHCLASGYGEIPGIKVKRLLFRPEQLSIATMLQLMAVGSGSQTTLYMAQVTKILRGMAAANGQLDFPEFKRQLANLRLVPETRNILDQRMGLLESFLDLEGNMTDEAFSFPKGSLTIVDLSCPFVDDNTACALFDVFLKAYFEADAGESCGKVVALDEAHRYLTDTPASKALTTSLIGLIRQQRQFGARIIISSQEPTLDPRLLDLSSMLVFHRFTSPEWANVLSRHVPLEGEDDKGRALLEKAAALRTGEAMVFASSGVLGDKMGRIWRLDKTMTKIMVRNRITWDGGQSVVAVE